MSALQTSTRVGSITGKPVVYPKHFSEWVDFNPDVARMWLSRSIGNRKIDLALVRKYTARLKEGRWGETCEPILISDTNLLLDGHHRCYGVINSGVTIEFYVTYGVDEKAFYKIDTGKQRAGAAQLGLAGIDNSKVVAACMQQLCSWAKYGKMGHCSAEDLPSSDMVEFHEKLDGEFLSECARLGKDRTNRLGLSPAVIGALAYIAGRENFEKFKLFHYALVTGANLGLDSPILTLRRWAAKNKKSASGSGRDAAAIGIARAWTNFCLGKKNPITVTRKGKGFPSIPESSEISLPWERVRTSDDAEGAECETTLVPCEFQGSRSL